MKLRNADRDKLQTFMSDLFSLPSSTTHLFYEMRVITTGRKGALVHWYDSPSELILSATGLQKPGDNLYFGVCPRKARSSLKRDVHHSQVLWVDVDALRLSSYGELVSFISERGVYAPSYVVDSGNGYHLYWCLAEPLYCLRTLEAWNRQLAERFNGDKCVDAGRVLRIPYTINYKPQKESARTSLIYTAGGKLPISYFEGALGAVRPPSSDPLTMALKNSECRTGQINPDSILMKLKPWTRALVLDGYTPGDRYPSRSHLVFKVLCDMAYQDLPMDAVLTVLTHPDYGISYDEKVHTQGRDPVRYLTQSYDKARRKVNETRETCYTAC